MAKISIIDTKLVKKKIKNCVYANPKKQIKH